MNQGHSHRLVQRGVTIGARGQLQRPGIPRASVAPSPQTRSLSTRIPVARGGGAARGTFLAHSVTFLPSAPGSWFRVSPFPHAFYRSGGAPRHCPWPPEAGGTADFTACAQHEACRSLSTAVARPLRWGPLRSRSKGRASSPSPVASREPGEILAYTYRLWRPAAFSNEERRWRPFIAGAFRRGPQTSRPPARRLWPRLNGLRPGTPFINEDIDLTDWMAANWPEVLGANFDKPASLFQKFPYKDLSIADGAGAVGRAGGYAYREPASTAAGRPRPAEESVRERSPNERERP